MINTQQAERSERNETKICLASTQNQPILKTQRRASQFDLQLTRIENLISNLKWNMSVLHQTVPNVWLDSRFNKAID